MRKMLICASLFSCGCIILPSTYAQGISNIGGVIQPASMSEPYGVNDTNILNSQTYVTRHRRIGQDTGIGSSFLQTTSPTSESSPALQTTSVPVARTRLRFPQKPVSMYGNIEQTPALSGEISKQYASEFGIGQQKQRSPSLLGPAVQSQVSAVYSDGLVRKPIIITEPGQQLNLHRTGGGSSVQY
jgi:hypothetical protein